MDSRRFFTVVVLGSTQTLAWASSYYLPAVLGDDIARDTGQSTDWLFGIFSASLVLTAVLGPRIGRMIDAAGGSGVLATSSHGLPLRMRLEQRLPALSSLLGQRPAQEIR